MVDGWNDAHAAMQAELAHNLGAESPAGFEATYTAANGTGTGTALISLGSAEFAGMRPQGSGPRFGQSAGPVRRTFKITVLAAAPGAADAGGGVDASKGVIELKAGDSFVVPGWRVGRDANTALTVTGLPDRVSGIGWVADVTV